jgi:hypothetical protein
MSEHTIEVDGQADRSADWAASGFFRLDGDRHAVAAAETEPHEGRLWAPRVFAGCCEGCRGEPGQRISHATRRPGAGAALPNAPRHATVTREQGFLRR